MSPNSSQTRRRLTGLQTPAGLIVREGAAVDFQPRQ